MLLELRVANFGLIDQLTLQFDTGFQVLTGETGAGKSLLVDALVLLVGGRASADHIRSDAEEAVLEAAFLLPAESRVLSRLQELGLVRQDERELIIRRVLSRSGRNRLYVNGSLTPLHLLQSLAGTLVDIHGQHDQQSLLSSPTQLDVVDGYGRLRDERKTFGNHYERWRRLHQELAETEARLLEDRQHEELLRFQCRELEGAQLSVGEEESLVQECRRLSHSNRLAELAQSSYELLYESDGSVLAGVRVIAAQIAEIASIDQTLEDGKDLCDGATVQLRELALRLRDYSQGLEQDPERLAVVEQRLAQLQALKKKYGGDVEWLTHRLEDIKERLGAIGQQGDRLDELRQRLGEERQELEILADRLSEGRRQAARNLECRIHEELETLHMGGIRFQVQVHTETGADGLGPSGRDRVEFLFSANPGEPLHPLARVASGGELSRVMLAIKSVLADSDGVPVLMFDEVDAGVGGTVATVMGQRLRNLGRYHQVFCITHLPQIASQARTHFVVQKEVRGNRTTTFVAQLEPVQREEEIARMLGGLKLTKAIRETAAQMIKEAQQSA